MHQKLTGVERPSRRPEHRDQFVAVEVELVDGKIADVGPTAFAAYVVLRREVRYRPRPQLLRWDEERFARGEKFASIKLDDLASTIGVSRSTIRAALERLSSAGWIRVERKDRHHANTYTLGNAGGWFALRREIHPSGESSARDEFHTSRSIPRCEFRTSGGVKSTPPTEALNSRLLKDQSQIGDQIGDQIGRTTSPATEPRKADPGPPPPPSPVADRLPHADPASEARGDQSPPTPPRGWRGALEGEKPTRRSRKPEAREVDDAAPDRPPIDASELEALQRARAKREAADRESHGEYTGEEAIALWRAAYWRAFGVDDAATEGRALRIAAADLYVRRLAARQWADGASSTLFSYLRDSIDLWAGKKREGDWPPGPAPTLEQLLREDRGKGPARYWLDWRARRAKAGGR